ncbi:TonB-dependent receptor [Colwellia sp. BRX10-9]|uniref:TonB-dependent receptor n=1 Tax=unclassified Colwellia TaxID=196834 RepID=UPI0015F55880|nr:MULTISPECIES: TonB-dependent receptor [unclassified Colwellia]MBA6372052.1 TonB-dependent receptor [Colwellia sp. BRX8-4]MBA6383191.1 TonB-dependent receptor [Colwellia sp. BRX10-9]
MNKLRLSKIASAIVIAVGLSTSAMAADTSSSMRGKILSPTGEAASNVKITVIHEPSKTSREFMTNATGTFTAKGLRVGGPYTVIIDSDTYSDTTLDNIFLNLGDTHRISQQLQADNIERIQVTGSSFLQKSGGSSSIFGAELIQNTPSFNRDIKDIARLNPLASINGNGELIIAGGNPRSNSLTVDGIGQNDDFGLNYGGYPTEQPPISLDAIAQISVDVSPFSAQKGNFGGGTINAVTKSGSNEFKFSGFAETSTPDMAGDVQTIDIATEVYYTDSDVDKKNPRVRNILDDDDHQTFVTKTVAPIKTQSRFGFNVGGPIIEDELFFFVNYSNWSSELAMDYGFQGSGATHEYDISQEQFDDFNTILVDVYGRTDSLGGDQEDTNETLLAKLSWNINDDHRLDFTYQWQDDQDERNAGTGGTTVSMASNRYTYATTFNNFATKIYSDWTNDFSTEMGISYKDVATDSNTNSDIGEITAITEYRGPQFVFGQDQFRHANESATQNLTLSLDATYLMDDHEINFGLQYEDLNLYNLFGANSLGSWEFASFKDFAARDLARYGEFTYQNSYTGDTQDLAYDVSRSQLSFYIEDNFDLTDDINVTAGVRYERLSSSDKPTLNSKFQETYGYTNQENLDGLDIILPRVNIEWRFSEKLTLSAGIGRFQGGIPNVWYNNPFQNDGITLVAASSKVVEDYYKDRLVEIDFNVPSEIISSLEKGAGSTNYTDPNFKLPSSWRSRIAADYTFDIDGLGENFNWSTELMYHVKENEAVWKNTALLYPITAADGERLIYESRYTGDVEDNFDIQMTNAQDNGRSIIFSTALAKRWDNGLSMTMSYAHQDIEENHAGSSSRAQSNYKNNVIKSRNIDFVARGNYEVEHNLKINLGYETEFFTGYKTNINLFFERRSGRPFSWVTGNYQDEDLGDTRDFYSNSAYLAYIPTGAEDPNVNWTDSGMKWNELEALLDRAGISERGEILDRNTGTQPWVTTMDLSIKQQIPGFAEGHKGEVFLMVNNFANMLNDDWGVEKRMGYPQQAIYDFAGLDGDGKYKIDKVYNGSDTRSYDRTVLGSSGWQMKVGINYKF